MNINFGIGELLSSGKKAEFVMSEDDLTHLTNNPSFVETSRTMTQDSSLDRDDSTTTIFTPSSASAFGMQTSQTTKIHEGFHLLSKILVCISNFKLHVAVCFSQCLQKNEIHSRFQVFKAFRQSQFQVCLTNILEHDVLQDALNWEI